MLALVDNEHPVNCDEPWAEKLRAARVSIEYRLGTQCHPGSWTDTAPAGRRLLVNVLRWAGVG